MNIAELILYRDEVRYVCNRMDAVYKKFKEGGDKDSVLASAKYYREYMGEIDKPTIDRDCEDAAYLRTNKSIKNFRIRIKKTLEDIKDETSPMKPEPEPDHDEIERAILAEESSHRYTGTKDEILGLPKPTPPLPSRSFTEDGLQVAYLEDMFVFHGNQIRQLYGTEKLCHLFARIFNHGI